MTELLDNLLEAQRLFVIVIDNPHLCLGRRITSVLDNIIKKNSSSQDITIVRNYPDCRERQLPNVRVIPIQVQRIIEDENEFLRSYLDLGNIDLFRDIQMPVSGLDLFDAAGFDSLIFAYRASYEVGVDIPDDINEPYDKVLIVGSSHFNYPFPEKILGKLKSKGLLKDNFEMIGLPIGPISGPFAPHWCSVCDQLIVEDSSIREVLHRISPDLKVGVLKDLFNMRDDDSGNLAESLNTSGAPRVFIDWTFIHNWQLKSLLRELITSICKDKIKVYFSAVSDETAEMMQRKWHHLLEEIDHGWIIIGTDEYFGALREMEVALGFVFGRDIWQMRGKDKDTLICDFAGWWQVFGFEGPKPPIATARKAVQELESIVLGKLSG